MLRVGQGYDIHPLIHGRRLVIGGVEIASEMGLEGHSDADVLVHAIMDALLGALALGDIGVHFPNTDERFRGADSVTLLREVMGLLGKNGAKVGNVDCTVIAEQPRLVGHIPAMRECLANAMGIESNAVSIKATTAEHLGSLGRGEGIAAYAVALVEVRA
jgi:2-C-methyl-D-erythritol 2,4-cyclodiphosphate synthase